MSDEPPASPRPGPASDDFDPKSHIWDGRQWWTLDRQFWWDGARWQPQDISRPWEALEPGALPKPKGYRRDFWLGFFGTIVGNVLLLIFATSGMLGSGLNVAPWILNFGALVLFAIIRPRVALGMLLAYGIALGLALLAGIFLAVVCFGGVGR